MKQLLAGLGVLGMAVAVSRRGGLGAVSARPTIEELRESVVGLSTKVSGMASSERDYDRLEFTEAVLVDAINEMSGTTGSRGAAPWYRGQ